MVPLSDDITVCFLLFQGKKVVETFEGAESVLLPCHVPHCDPEGSVSWTIERPSSRWVHYRHQSRDYLGRQDEKFDSRTSMARSFSCGNFSLTLRNLVATDSDTYSCIYMDRGMVERNRREVYLNVTGQICRFSSKPRSQF